MNRSDWAYVAACVLVPLCWGAVAAKVFAALDRRRAWRKPDPDEPPMDYMI
jgi:hypothetical protein